MKSIIIASINENLNHAIDLIHSIDTDTFCDTSVGPYFSSIGSHLRHVLDFFDCVVRGLDDNAIDLTARKRDALLSTDKEAAKTYIYDLQQTMLSFVDVNTDYLIHVTDHLGKGKVTVAYTLESILTHANSHATHHFATIGYLLTHQGVDLRIPSFGYNPTTPLVKRKGI